MKKLLYPLAGLALVVSVASCNMAGEEDYSALSKDMCDCVEKSTANMSDGMRTAVVDASKNGKDFQASLMEYMMKDPEAAQKDAEILGNMGTDLDKCGKDLETKYKDIYTNDTEKQVQDKLMKAMEKEKGCEFTYALMKIGMSMQK